MRWWGEWFYSFKRKVLRITWSGEKIAQNIFQKQLGFPPPDMSAEKFPLALSIGGWAEGQGCADPGARTTIATSGNWLLTLLLLTAVLDLKTQGEHDILDKEFSPCSPLPILSLNNNSAPNKDNILWNAFYEVVVN